MSDKIDPMSQFNAYELLSLKLFGHDISITNSSAVVIVCTFLACAALFYGVTRMTHTGKPATRQLIVELLFGFVKNMTDELIGTKHKSSAKYTVYIFALFSFVLLLNLAGMIPHVYAPTSQVFLTFALGIITFGITVFIVAYRHGFMFYKVFIPEGTPIFLAPVIMVLEMFSFLSRPFSLAIRLSANIVAGHVMLHVIASFALLMGVVGILPFALLIAVDMFEIMIAMLQAYIFALLSSIYIGEALHH